MITPPRIEPPRKPLTIPQVVRAARSNLIEIIPGLAYQQPIVSGRTIARWHMLQDPDGLERVFKDKVAIYPKSDVSLRLLRPAIGDSLFVAEGAHWRWQRRAAAPVFQHRNLIALAPFMTRAADRTLHRLDAAHGHADLYQEMVTATFDVISEVAMSGDKAIDRDAVSRSVTDYIETVGRISLFDVLAVPTWIPRPAQLFNRSGVSAMQQMMDRVIAERARAPRRDDLMSLMLEASDPETGRAMTPEELRDNMLAFLVAGHETTALALSWAIYLAACDPKVQDRLAEEARAACGDGPAEAQHLDRLGYARQVIEEAMRLYPPAGMLSRTAREEDEICGRQIRKGDTVILPIYALHRHRLWWENADQFDPENFAPAKTKGRNRYLYLPFGAGPRICIGMNFALIEAQIILASLMARFRFTPMAGVAPVPEMVMTLRPAGGVRLQVSRRDGPYASASSAESAFN
ncbi:MAG: cytochrome P450 [Pseudomonadota bacterium]